MTANQDFKDLFVEFNSQGVEFLVVGAHALAAHGHVRATKDLDVWVRPDRQNAGRVMRALTAFGAPTHNVTEDDFAAPGITSGEPVFVLSREDLIRNKRASARPQDLADVAALEQRK